MRETSAREGTGDEKAPDGRPRGSGEDAAEPQEGWTPWARSVATAGAVLALLGLSLGILPFLLLSLVLLGSLVLSRTAGGVSGIGLTLERDVNARQVRAGATFPVEWRIAWTRGGAVVTLHDELPDAAHVRGGANFHVLGLPPRAGEASVRYDAALLARGPRILPGTKACVLDPMGMRAALPEPVAPHAEVLVEPSAPAVPRMRSPAAYGSSLFPEGDLSRRGPATNDFRELRPYVQGDPLRSVNWKATARASTQGDSLELIVNEYEVEGKKSVWLFLDQSHYLAGGTNVRTTFDSLVEATLSVGGYYLNRGHRVGFSLYGGPETKLLYPDAGTQQIRRLHAHLTYAAPAADSRERVKLTEAVLEARGFLGREKPLIHVLTLLGRDVDGLTDGLAQARALAATGRRPAPSVILSPKTPPTPSHADRLLDALAAAEAAGLRSRGVVVLEWDPGRVPIQALLAAGGWAR